MRPRFGRRLGHALLAAVMGLGVVLLQIPLGRSAHAVATDTATAYQIDSGHSGGQPADPIAPPLTRWWSVDFGGTVSYPLIAQGMVYVTVAENWLVNGSRLYAVDQASGRTIWRSIELGGGSYWSAATYDEGRVFVGNAANLLRAFDASNGTLLWSLQLPGQSSSSSAPTASNGVVYAVGYGSGGTLYAVRETDGTVLWRVATSTGDESSPAVSTTGVYVAFGCSHVYDFAPSNGALIWSHAGTCIGGSGRTSALYNGRLYTRDPLTPSSNAIYDAQTGAAAGAYAAGPAPAFDNSMGFYLNGSALEAHALSTGAQAWTFAGDGALSSAPIVINGYVYEGSTSGNLYALAASTGSLAWSVNLGAPIRAPDETNLTNPLAGIAAGQGMLAVPAGTTLNGFGVGAAPSPSITPVPTPAPSPYPPPISDGDQAVTYQNDVAHTGLQQADSLRPALVRKWSVDLGEMVSYALIAQGMMYVTVADPPPATGSPHGARLFALDQTDGHTVWGPYELGGSAQWANAAYDNGRVFALNVDGLMRAYDAKSGARLWSTQIPDRSGTTTCSCFASAPTAANGIVYTSGGGVAQVSALSESTGAVLWQEDVMGSDHSSPAVSPDGVYVTYTCNQSYDFNPTTGALKWHYQTPCTGGGGKTPVLNSGKLYARDEPLAPNPIIDSESGERVGQFVSAYAPVIDGSIGLFYSGLTTLQARDLSTNQALWTFTEDRPLTAPIVVDGYVYIGTGVGVLYVLDEKTGRQVYRDYLWEAITGPDESNVSSPLAGLTVGQGLLAVPAFHKLFVYGSSGNPPWPPPSFTPVPNTSDQSVTYQANPQHNGDLPGAAFMPPLTKSWSVDFGEQVSYPVVAEGLVFVTTGTFNDSNHPFTHLYALHQSDGSVAWGPIPLELDVGDHWAALAYDGGRLFSLNSAGWLKAWEGTTGTELWAMQLPAPFSFNVNAPPTAMNGFVYVTGSGDADSGGLVAIDETNGTIVWQQAVTNGYGSSPAVSTAGVYETFQCHQVWDFNPSTGALVWHHADATNCAAGEVPVLANGKLYERDYLGTNLIFDAAGGSVVGTFAADAAPATDGTLVYLVTNAYAGSGTLEAHDATSGNMAWTFTGDGTLSTAPFVVHGVVYIGSTSGNLYALDGLSGRQVWSTNVGSTMRVAPGYGTGAPWPGLGAGQGYLFVAAGNTLVAYTGTGTGPSPSPSPTPTASPSPTPNGPPGSVAGPSNSWWSRTPARPVVPACCSAPNPWWTRTPAPPVVPSCCSAFSTKVATPSLPSPVRREDRTSPAQTYEPPVTVTPRGSAVQQLLRRITLAIWSWLGS
ncbi:MAG TPA: PQQ-binding-like beta-propeller repeat protein [Candidatus Dormibacteraeota bacterium]